MKYAAATSGHQFPLVRFPASRATLEFTTKFIVMSTGCPCATAAPHTLRYIHCFAHKESPGNGGASLVVRFMIERQLLHTSTRGSVAPSRSDGAPYPFYSAKPICASALKYGASKSGRPHGFSPSLIMLRNRPAPHTLHYIHCFARRESQMNGVASLVVRLQHEL